MQLNLGGRISIVEATNFRIELPSWMELLPSHELSEACKAQHCGNLIIAAGCAGGPTGSSIVCLMGSGNFLELSRFREKLPVGMVLPGEYGTSLVVKEWNGNVHESASDWVLERGKPLVDFHT